ncbi:hypothetical protein B7P43_G07078 [Cryptotermes secundus]|uniref:Uncharacterized protein n=1 Tax=Cryptotermes secundus TaxID=105785 RepID=A0A2J7RHD7_9NEOP|nr:hypothetical protein B7P43_G07078 [Cryptotermes secundus]
MASPQQKAFCVLEFAKTNSVVTVQRAFRRRFGINPPCPKNIRRWFRQFQESGCLCKGKSPGRPRVSEEQVARIRAAFERSPRKSTNRASRELAIPQSTVWRVLTVRLHLKPYRLQLVQALTNDDKRKRMEFCDSMLEMMEDETFISRLIFSDEATFHLSGTVNRHNVRIWGTEHPHETVEHERDSPKVNVFCAVSQDKVYGPFFFEGNTVTGQTYLDMLQNWLFTSLQADSHDFIFQQDGARPHWHLMVRAFLNEKVPQRWIGRKGAKDLALCAWPARSPDLTVCDFFLWGYVKDHVYDPPLPANPDDLKHRIATAINSVHRDMLIRAWEESSYRIDVARAGGGGHIEHL